MAKVNSRTPRRKFLDSGVSVRTCMPAAAGNEHDAGKPRMPSICTKHVRHAPIGFISGSLQSWEILVPEEFIASKTEEPSGTSRSVPFIVRVMVAM